MLREALILGVVLSLVVFVSGCTTTTPGSTGELTKSQMEDKAAQLIEQELQQATENIDVSDIENSLGG